MQSFDFGVKADNSWHLALLENFARGLLDFYIKMSPINRDFTPKLDMVTPRHFLAFSACAPSHRVCSELNKMWCWYDTELPYYYYSWQKVTYFSFFSCLS